MEIAPPRFTSPREHDARKGDVDFWSPYVTEILKRHDLFDSGIEPEVGFNVTHPTFVVGEVVVKLFGYAPATWRKNYTAELAAQKLVSTDPEIAAPRLLGSGHLYDRADEPWPYLIIERVSGAVSWRADLSAGQERALAAELGRQVRRVHALSGAGVATEADWPVGSVSAAAERSSLPPHLIEQIDDYLAGLELTDHVVVNGDIVANHVYVRDGRLVGIIDWGDTMVTDRHVEIIQIFRDMFDCDKARLRLFLSASDWPVDGNLPRKALGCALLRQAIGLAQHGRIDVFEPIAAKYPLLDIVTLDELALELFDV